MTTALVRQVVEDLNAMIGDDTRTSIPAFEKEVRGLVYKFKDINDVLEDADRRQVRTAGDRDWIRKLNEVVNSAVEIVDDLRMANFKSLSGEDEYANLNCMMVRSCLLFGSRYLTQVKLRYHAGRRIRELKERLNELLTERRYFSPEEVNTVEWRELEVRQTTSLIDHLYLKYNA